MLEAFRRRCEKEKLTIHSAAVQQDGRLLDEWYVYPKDRPHILHSLSKSFAAMGVGLAIAEGKLSLEDKMVSFFPDKLAKPLNEYQAAVTIRHLLTMTPGLDKPRLLRNQRSDAADPDWVRLYLESPTDRMPGQAFSYDTGCTYMLSAILTRVTGETLLDYLRPRLFDPMGMEPIWHACPLGITLGGAGLYLKTPELIDFGQMLLDGGTWKGRRLIPGDWVKACTSFQMDNAIPGAPKDGRCGYGYQFWLCHNGAFRADGANCQLCIVWPEKRAVIAVTAHEPNGQAVMDALWDTVGPALS